MRPLVVAACLAVSGISLAACTRTVGVPAAVPSSSAAASACAAAIAALPAELVDQKQLNVEPANANTAAWGLSPPITLRCGVAAPAGLRPTSEVLDVNGIKWFPEQLSAGYVFTSVGLAANVEVAVPDRYRPEAAVLAELSPAIALIPPA